MALCRFGVPLQDVRNKPGISAAWRQDMFDWIQQDDAPISVKRQISGIWLPDEYEGTDLLEEQMITKTIADEDDYERRLSAARRRFVAEF